MANYHRISGALALLCVDVLFLFSTKFVRHNYYNLFFRSHFIALVLVLPAVSILYETSFVSFILMNSADILPQINLFAIPSRMCRHLQL